MDFKRILLITGLVVVGYLIILQWSHDSQLQPTTNTVAGTHENKTPVHRNGIGLSDAPLPLTEKEEVKTTAKKFKANDDAFISVSTDKLQLKIGLHGGNIIHLALPSYPKKQGEEAPYVLFDNSDDLTYLAQSGLTGKDGPDSSGVPLYSVDRDVYKLEKNQENLTVDLHLRKDGVDIIKRYVFTHNSYNIKLSYIIANQARSAWTANFYAQLKRDNSKDPGLLSNKSTSIHSYLGAALRTNEKEFQKVEFSDFSKSPFRTTITGGYAAILQHYFVAAWVPEQDKQVTYTAREVSGEQKYNIIGFYGTPVTVQPEQTSSINATLYAGPKIGRSLEQLAKGLDLTIDYGWLWFIASPMFAFMNFLHKLLGNWGWSIIVLTMLIKLIFYPLSAASYRSMAKMRALQPKMQALKERYSGDRQKMSQALMEMYKKEKVNPMGGCLPILVQMPFFIALYEVLMEAVQLRQAPWILWIHDLSRMDPYFILPIVMGGLMFVQQRLSPAPPDPTQAKIMRLMPVIFTIFFLWFPAGLVIYWVTNNFLSILQQWWITRSFDKKTKALAK